MIEMPEIGRVDGGLMKFEILTVKLLNVLETAIVTVTDEDVIVHAVTVIPAIC